jgi:hypothetical protein
MTETEFLEKLKTLVSFRIKKVKENYWQSDQYIFFNFNAKPDKRKKNIPENPGLDELYLHKEWRVGGRSGGSCYDTGEPVYHGIDGDPEPEFTEIDTVIEAFCPEISFLNYKKLMKAIKMEEGTYTESEYYGNYTNHAFKVVKLSDFYAALKEMKLI